MIKAILEILIAVLMVINPELPAMLDLGKLPSENMIDMDKFVLVWSDEFNGTELDKSKWGYNWWERERKGGYWHEDMVEVKNGNLVITTAYFENGLPTPEAYKGYFEKHPSDKDYRGGWYTGVVETRGKFEGLYGYYEAVRTMLRIF